MKKTVFSLMAIAIALVSCNKQESNVNVALGGEAVRFTASLSQEYTVKSTTVDNPFDVNGQVGIFAGTPINNNNVAYKVSTMPTTEPAAAGALAAVDQENPILWKQGQSAATTFYAYRPYDSNSTDMTAIPVSVGLDQTTLAAVNAADFMTATAADVAVRATAPLAFNHKLHKVIVKVENKLAQEITKVEIKNVRVAATANLTTDEVTATEDAPSTVVAYANGSVNETVGGVNHTYHVYDAIIVPQNAQPEIIVTIGSNTTYTFSLAAALDFDSNKTSTATLLVESAAASANAASFSFTIGAWGDNTDMSFGNGQKHVVDPFCWSMIGTIAGTSWNQDFYMAQNNQGEFYLTGFTLSNGDTFKFRKGSAWADEQHTAADGYLQYGVEAGTPAVTIPDNGVDIGLAADNNDNIVISITGTGTAKYDIYLKPASNKVWIQKSAQ